MEGGRFRRLGTTLRVWDVQTGRSLFTLARSVHLGNPIPGLRIVGTGENGAARMLAGFPDSSNTG